MNRPMLFADDYGITLWPFGTGEIASLFSYSRAGGGFRDWASLKRVVSRMIQQVLIDASRSGRVGVLASDNAAHITDNIFVDAVPRLTALLDAPKSTTSNSFITRWTAEETIVHGRSMAGEPRENIETGTIASRRQGRRTHISVIASLWRCRRPAMPGCLSLRRHCVRAGLEFVGGIGAVRHSTSVGTNHGVAAFTAGHGAFADA